MISENKLKNLRNELEELGVYIEQTTEWRSNHWNYTFELSKEKLDIIYTYNFSIKTIEEFHKQRENINEALGIDW